MPKGKIIKSLSGFYYVKQEDGVIVQCRGRGIFRKNKITPLVGDNVFFEAENTEEGTIIEIKDRINELTRPPIANIERAILVFSADEPEFSPVLLDRFLVLVEEKGIEPVICLTKMDLKPNAEKEEVQTYIDVYTSIGYKVYTTSTKTSHGVESIRPLLDNKVTVIAGQSGVGKSSLLNALQPDLNLKTDDISNALGRGKHTTRHVELIPIDNGLVADTPGFSALEFTTVELDQLSLYFPEIRERLPQCKFRGCTHISEPKCAIKEAIKNGEIAQFRYDHYVSFYEEIKDRKPRY